MPQKIIVFSAHVFIGFLLGFVADYVFRLHIPGDLIVGIALALAIAIVDDKRTGAEFALGYALGVMRSLHVIHEILTRVELAYFGLGLIRLILSLLLMILFIFTAVIIFSKQKVKNDADPKSPPV